MAVPETVERVAAITATLHDGKNLIALKQDATVRVAQTSIPFLEARGALKEEGAAADAQTGQVKAQSDEEFDVPEGYSLTEKGGGWYEITGDALEEPIKVRGEDNVRAALDDLGEESAPV